MKATQHGPYFLIITKTTKLWFLIHFGSALCGVNKLHIFDTNLFIKPRSNDTMCRTD